MVNSGGTQGRIPVHIWGAIHCPPGPWQQVSILANLERSYPCMDKLTEIPGFESKSLDPPPI